MKFKIHIKIFKRKSNSIYTFLTLKIILVTIQRICIANLADSSNFSCL